jgi:hypothetical protein
MAQHDYVIANGTGAAVRSDINNGLAAIVSNNSGATAPSTTYAYQWWADTTTGLLKLRNAANNAWITLFQLDGEWSTLAVENGSAAAPSIYFKDSGTDTGIYSPGTDQVAISTGGTVRLSLSTTAVSSALAIDHPLGSVGTPSITFTGDLNTGIYSPAADTLAFVEGAVEAMRIDSSGRVGIGTTSPSYLLDCQSTGATNVARFLTGAVTSSEVAQFGRSDQAVNLSIDYDGAGAMGIGTTTAHPFLLKTGATEKARLDISGRLLVGTSTAFGSNDELLHIASPSAGSIALLRNDTSIGSGNELGGIRWYSNATTSSTYQVCAQIRAVAEGTFADGDKPSRLEFSTTADGASSPTERMRLSSTGKLNVFDSSGAGLRVNSAVGSSSTDNVFTGFYGASSTTAEGTASIAIRTNGDVRNTNNSYGALSDVKLKENIADANSQWDDLKAVRVRNFNLKEGQTHRQIGVIAQELELVSPGLVSESPDFDADGNDLGTVTKSVNYSVLYMKAVKALQEAMERIETLEAKVATLEAL